MADDEAARPRSEAGGGGEVARTGETALQPDSAVAPETAEEGGATPSEIDQVRAELAALRDRWLRERAELENYKKRVAREKAEALRFASEPLLRDLLPIIDNLHRALEHARAARESEPLVQGVELVVRALDETLGRYGVRIVEARGATFDPSLHEAIGHVESEEPPNTVIDEHQRGYLLHDRLLRPALVTVGKGRGGAGGVEKRATDD